MGVETDAAAAGDMPPDAIRDGAAAVNGRTGPAGTLTQSAPATRGLPYKVLRQTHPTYDAGYWRELRALYEGGKCLLRDGALMNRLFPRHRNELDTIYRERKSRAFYVPYAAEILDHLIAGLTSDPLTMSLGEDEQSAEKPLPDFYQDFSEDVSPEGGQTISLNELLGDQLRTALQTCWAWTLVDLPPPVPERSSAAEQEKAGDLNAFAVAIQPESVIDWEEDEAGELLWALIHVVEAKRASLSGSRSRVTQRWTYYTPTDWERYELTHDDGKEPSPDEVVPLVASGAHSFGRVPLVRLCLPEGLWAMNKMGSIAVEHFNKRAALAWGEFQSLLPELYEYQGPEMAGKGALVGQAQEDADRARNQPRGQGYVQIRGADDEAEFVGPSAEPFAEARMSCDSLRDDLHRVMHQMALSAANSPSALKRSAESKEQDKSSVEVVLSELGRIARKHAAAVLDMVSRGRQEQDFVGEWTAKGMSEFEAVAVGDMLDQAVTIDTLSIESPTFRRVHRAIVARQVLADKATPEQLEQIEKELEENIDDESFKPGADLESEVERATALAKVPQPGASLKPGGNGAPKRGRPAAE